MSQDAPAPTLPQSADPYEVLGVARDVSDRDLKKRYFALIRQFPPETHPEEFNRLQQAYDTLGDPAKRAAHAQAQVEPFEEVPEPHRTRLREALAQLERGEVEFGRTQLKALVEEAPTLTAARMLLSQVYFNTEAWADAERELKLLVQQEPDASGHRERLVLVLSRQQRHAEAEQVARAWVQHSQRQDVVAWRMLADALSAQERALEALGQLAEALAGFQGTPAGRISLHLDRLAVGRHVKAYPVKSDLDACLQTAGPDANLKGQLAKELSAIAALYFDRSRADDANLLLRVGRELQGGHEKDALEFPARVQAWLEELPQASLDWLVEESKQPHIYQVKRGWLAGGVLTALVLTPALMAAAAAALTPHESYGGELVAIFLGLGLLAMGTVWAWRRIAWGWSPDVKPLYALHPLYLLEMGPEALVAWPLVNFRDIQITHQMVNGAYTESRLKLLGAKDFTISVRGQQAAVDLANTLFSYRTRALKLLHAGMLQAEPGFDFLPQAMLRAGWRSPATKDKRLALLKRCGWALAATVVVCLLALWQGARAGRDRTAEKLLAAGEWSEIRPLLGGADPSLVKEIQAWRQAGLARLTPELLAELPADGASHRAAKTLLTALQAPGAELAVALTVEPNLPTAPEGLEGPSAVVFTPGDVTRFASGLGRGLDGRVRHWVQPVAGGEAPIRLEVRVAPTLSGPALQYAGLPTKFASLGLLGTVTLTAGGERLELPVEARPTPERAAELETVGPDGLWNAQARLSLDALGSEVAKVLGVGRGYSTAVQSR